MKKKDVKTKNSQADSIKTETTIEKKKPYSIEEAIKLVKENCKCKFDSTVEAHFNLGLDAKKTEQNIRVSTTLPHGTGKSVKVAVLASGKVPNADLELGESDIAKIGRGELKPHADFDVIVAEPKFMSKLAQVAKILGPQGMMPNPKAGTVTEDVKKAVDQIKKGKVEIRTEPNAPIIHVIIGKRSFDDNALIENFQEIVSTIRQNRPAKANPETFIKSCFISTTMSPSVLVAL